MLLQVNNWDPSRERKIQCTEGGVLAEMIRVTKRVSDNQEMWKNMGF